ncbi:hypothetical protein FAGAP_3819 [Fusarium agapanthi]|uniref:Uncharacterized protein n=1 Tax=Fusarium agapanthi TaxID=1803897 RepID=A0A9P5EG35_9HYPO|nr:hypothetical protein FAGAP_3819 [Fusarium agapanthi]
MVGSDPSPAPHEPNRARGFNITIMDLNVKDQDENEEAADLANNCYASTTWKTRLQPEDSAAYACRWIPVDRGKILSRLRIVQRRQEMKSTQGPNFRPVFVPLYDEDQVENMLGIPDLEQAKSDLPAFVSIPTIDLVKLCSLTFPENSHHVKSLLQYHYKFGIHNNTVQKPAFELASILDGVRSPCVDEVWCLAFDSKNLITVSWLEADTIPRIAISEFFQNDRNPPQERYGGPGLVVMDFMVFFGIVGQILSAVVPGGWMLDQLFRKVEKYVFGIDSSDIIRIGSFFEVLSRSVKEMRTNAEEEWCFSPLRTVLGFSPGRYDGEPLRNLSALDEHMQHWIEVERTTWSQAEASEDVAQAVRDLWFIAIRFTMNFHLSPDRDIFQLDRLGIWRRIVNYISHD